MKLIVNNNNTHDIGHDDSVDEYLLYVMTNDNVIDTAIDCIYGEASLAESIANIKSDHIITETIYIPYNKTTQQGLLEVQN